MRLAFALEKLADSVGKDRDFLVLAPFCGWYIEHILHLVISLIAIGDKLSFTFTSTYKAHASAARVLTQRHVAVCQMGGRPGPPPNNHSG